MAKYSKSAWKFDTPESISMIDELPYWSAPFGIKLLSMIRLRRNMTAVDIGCGLGFPLTILASMLGSTGKIYGIDPWKKAAERARQKISYFGIRNAEIIESEAESISLADSSVDLIVSNNGLNNVSDLNKTFSEIRRISRAGSQIVFTVNLDGTMKEFYLLFEQVLTDLDLEEIIPVLRQHIYLKRRPVNEYEELLKESGFVNTEILYDQFTYRFADGSAMFEFPFIKYAFMDSWLELLPHDRTEEVFMEIERRMNIISSSVGVWTISVPYAVITADRN